MSIGINLRDEEKAVFGLRELYGKSGYRQYRMSKFEEYDLYVRNKNFLVSDNIITFTDTNGRLMALKPDVTLSIVRSTKDVPGEVSKVYYNENVYRPSRGSSGFREIMQVGLECIGAVDEYCVYEVLTLAAQSLAEISEDYVLDVSHLGILSSVIDRIGVSQEAKPEILRCVGEKNYHDMENVLSAENIPDEKKKILRDLLVCDGVPGKVLEFLSGLFDDGEWKNVVGELDRVIPKSFADKVRIDFSVINDMSYYNGIVFQGFIKGIPNGVLSGGQYDKLMRKMGRNAGAIGFAVYLDQISQLSKKQDEYDVDTVLLYTENDAPETVRAALEKLSENGDSVCAMKDIPEKLRYRKAVRI